MSVSRINVLLIQRQTIANSYRHCNSEYEGCSPSLTRSFVLNDKATCERWGPENVLREIRFTAGGAVLGVGLILTAALTNIDLVKLNLKFLESVERHQLDDMLIGVTFILVGLIIDRILSRLRRRKRQQDEIEALRLQNS